MIEPPVPTTSRSAPAISHLDLALLQARVRPFSAIGWIFELKYDGYRCLAKRGSTAQMFSRQGNDMSRAFPELIRDLEHLPPATAIDGELVMLDEHGHPKFDELLGRSAVSRPQTVAKASRERPAAIVAWDILMYAGLDVRHLPLLERKTILRRALKGMQRVLYATHVEGHGEAMYGQAVTQELEGIVAKRVDSPYTAGRTANWVKIKTPIGRERETRRMERRR